MSDGYTGRMHDVTEHTLHAVGPPHRLIAMGERKRIALVAHDNCKHDLLDWARFNRELLRDHELYATGTTGRLLEGELSLSVVRFLSGPLEAINRLGRTSPMDGSIF